MLLDPGVLFISSVMELESLKASLTKSPKERQIFVPDYVRWHLKSLIQRMCHVLRPASPQVLEVKFWHAVSLRSSNKSLSSTCLNLKQLIIFSAISSTYTQEESAFIYLFFFSTISECYSSGKKHFLFSNAVKVEKHNLRGGWHWLHRLAGSNACLFPFPISDFILEP